MVTYGMERVRASFNPSNNKLVDKIKAKTAELIDICNELEAQDSLSAVEAQARYEEAAMWAVKAATA